MLGAAALLHLVSWKQKESAGQNKVICMCRFDANYHKPSAIEIHCTGVNYGKYVQTYVNHKERKKINTLHSE